MLPTSFWIELHSEEPPLFEKCQIFHPLSRHSKRVKSVKLFFCLFSVCYLNCSKKFDSEQCTQIDMRILKYSFNLSPHIYTIPCYGELSRMNFKLCTVLYIIYVALVVEFQTIETYEWCHALWSYYFYYMVFWHIYRNIRLHFTQSLKLAYSVTLYISIVCSSFMLNISQCSSWWIFHDFWFWILFLCQFFFSLFINKLLFLICFV